MSNQGNPSKAKLNPILHNISKQYSGEFKRPNSPEFMTSTELKQMEWSGVRENPITKDFEFWVVGEIRKVVNTIEMRFDPEAIEKAYKEVFHL